MPIGALGAALGVGSAVSGFFGSRKAEKESRKSRRSAEAIQAKGLELVRQTFDQFKPLIQDTTDFFRSVSLDDIASGRVVSPEGRAAIRAVNEAQNTVDRQTQVDLARRGISSDVAGAAIQAQQRGERVSRLADVVDRTSQRAIDRRVNFANTGLGLLGSQVNQLNTIAGSQFARAANAGQVANQAAAGAGSGLGLLADLAVRSQANQNVQRIRRLPTDIDTSATVLT